MLDIFGKGQRIVPQLRVERITTAYTDVFVNAVHYQGKKFNVTLVQAVGVAFDRKIGNWLSDKIPDIMAYQDPVKLDNYTCMDIFVDPNDLSKGIKPAAEMCFLTSTVYSMMSAVTLASLSHEERGKYTMVMNQHPDKKYKDDLRSYLRIYFEHFHHPLAIANEAQEAFKKFVGAKYNTSCTIENNINYFQRAFTKAKELNPESVNEATATNLFVAFIKSSEDNALISAFDRVRFPSSRDAPVTDINKLVHGVEAYAKENPSQVEPKAKQNRGGGGQPKPSGNSHSTNATFGTPGTSNGKGTPGESNTKTSNSGKQPQQGNNKNNNSNSKRELCEQCLFHYPQGSSHVCKPAESWRCIACGRTHHYFANCPNVPAEVKKVIIDARKKSINSHFIGLNAHLAEFVDNNDTCADAIASESFISTAFPSEIENVDLTNLTNYALLDCGTNITVLNRREFFVDLTELPQPIVVDSAAGGRLCVTHYGPAEFFIINTVDSLKVVYQLPKAYFCADIPFGVVDTLLIKRGGTGAFLGSEQGSRLCTFDADGEIRELVHLNLGLAQVPDEMHNMIYAVVEPVGRSAQIAFSPIINAHHVANADMGQPLTLAVRRAGSPGNAVVSMLRKDPRYSFIPSSGARPLDPANALGAASRKQPSHASRGFNAHKTINEDKSLHIDISGPHPPAPDFFDQWDGEDVRFGLHATAKPSNARGFCALPSKAGPVVASVLDALLSTVGYGAKLIFADNAKELNGKEVRAVMDKHGVADIKNSSPDEKEGNAVAEAGVRQDRARGASIAAGSRLMPRFCWPILFTIAAALCTYLPTARPDGSTISPHEAKYGRPFNFATIRVPGCLAYVHHADRPNKVDPPASAGIYIGRAEHVYNRRGHVVLFPESGKVIVTHHVAADETKFPELSARTWLSRPVTYDDDYFDAHGVDPTPGASNVHDMDYITFEPLPAHPLADIGRGGEPATSTSSVAQASEVDVGRGTPPSDVDEDTSPVADTANEPPMADIGRGDVIDHITVDDIVVYNSGPATPVSGPATPTLDEIINMTAARLNALSKAKAKDIKRGIPITVKQAINGPDGARWKAAIRKELQSLKDLGVFLELQDIADVELYADVDPANINIIYMDFTWAFKIKMDHTYRARIALRGFKSGPLPLSEISSPTASIETFRILMALSVSNLQEQFSQHKMRELQFDVDHAFMRGKNNLHKRLYICPVPEFYPLDDPNTKHLLAVGSLYGGKDASNIYYKYFSNTIMSKPLNFKRSHADACLFYKYTASGGLITCLIHVDDGKVIGFTNSDKEWDSFVHDLQRAFNDGIKILDGSMHVGMDVARTSTSVTISVKTYLASALSSIDPDDNIPKQQSPYIRDDMEKLIFYDKTDRLNFKDSKRFLEILGVANYARSRCRVDIEYPMALISTKTSTPTAFAWQALMHVIGYLKQNVELGITYSSGDLSLLAHSDASLNPLPGGRQFGGIFVSAAGGAVAYSTFRETIATDNTADAELLAAWKLARKVEGIIELFESIQIKIPLPVPIGQDNGATMLAMTTLTSRKSRHLALKLGVIRDLVQERFIIDPKHIHSDDNLSDGMTKVFNLKTFLRFRDLWLNIGQSKRFVPREHPPHAK